MFISVHQFSSRINCDYKQQNWTSLPILPQIANSSGEWHLIKKLELHNTTYRNESAQIE